jgi:hypothetical protein
MYGPFKEIDNIWRIRRNDELLHNIINRNVNFMRSEKLRWFGYVHGMNSERLVKGINKWTRELQEDQTTDGKIMS